MSGTQCISGSAVFGVTAAVFGAGLLLGSMTFLLWSLFLFCWLYGFLIPFEERARRALRLEVRGIHVPGAEDDTIPQKAQG
jgi:hypothetical protein